MDPEEADRIVLGLGKKEWEKPKVEPAPAKETQGRCLKCYYVNLTLSNLDSFVGKKSLIFCFLIREAYASDLFLMCLKSVLNTSLSLKILIKKSDGLLIIVTSELYFIYFLLYFFLPEEKKETITVPEDDDAPYEPEDFMTDEVAMEIEASVPPVITTATPDAVTADVASSSVAPLLVGSILVYIRINNVIKVELLGSN